MSGEYRCQNPACNSDKISVGKESFRCLSCGIKWSKSHHCPRCKRKYLMDFDTTVECPVCNLEFEKQDFDEYTDDDDILSLQEKHEIAKLLRES
ncbi:hypothetical protein ES705_23281 [subsurface metagenome]